MDFEEGGHLRQSSAHLHACGGYCVVNIKKIQYSRFGGLEECDPMQNGGHESEHCCSE